MVSGDLTMLAVGDLSINREDPESMFDCSRELLHEADISFGQLEIVYSELGSRQVHHRAPLHAHPRNVSVLQSVGFSVVSFAGNHCMDWGVEAFFDTISNVQKAGIKVVGVGKNIEEARKPVIIERNGVRVAFLAYNSILDLGYWAESERPGCVPIRIFTVYEPIEPDQPGQPARVLTLAHPDDVKNMVEDITKAKQLADIVAVSMHWGLHHVPAKIAMYQRAVGHQAIDAGADIILGTHAHILKGIEVYKGKVIFYSLGNFAFDSAKSPEMLRRLTEKRKDFADFATYKIDPEWASTYAFPADARKSVIVRCLIENKQIKGCSFIPVLINKQAQPVPCNVQTEDFNQVVKYIKDISRDQSLDTRFNVEGNEVVVS